ncbi:MAG: TonB-dependent receptor [Flavobacteriales bacterium]
MGGQGYYYWSPYLGIEYQLNESHDWKIKFNVSNNMIKYPTINDLYYVPGGNPYLKLEKMFAFELKTSFRCNWWNIQNGLR